MKKIIVVLINIVIASLMSGCLQSNGKEDSEDSYHEEITSQIESLSDGDELHTCDENECSHNHGSVDPHYHEVSNFGKVTTFSQDSEQQVYYDFTMIFNGDEILNYGDLHIDYYTNENIEDLGTVISIENFVVDESQFEYDSVYRVTYPIDRINFISKLIKFDDYICSIQVFAKSDDKNEEYEIYYNSDNKLINKLDEVDCFYYSVQEFLNVDISSIDNEDKKIANEIAVSLVEVLVEKKITFDSLTFQ